MNADWTAVAAIIASKHTAGILTDIQTKVLNQIIDEISKRKIPVRLPGAGLSGIDSSYYFSWSFQDKVNETFILYVFSNGNIEAYYEFDEKTTSVNTNDDTCIPWLIGNYLDRFPLLETTQ
jgi:hypothetical protein